MAIWPGLERPGSQHRGAQVPAVREQEQASVVQGEERDEWAESYLEGIPVSSTGLRVHKDPTLSPHLYSWGMGGGLGNSETCFSDILGCYDFPPATHHAKALWTGV